MKKPLCLIILLLATLQLSAQFTLSGTIRFTGEKPGLTINIPTVFGYHRENTIVIPVTDSGRFHITIPCNSPKFATLIFRQTLFTLLLTPESKVEIALNAENRSIQFIAGNAVKENQVLQEIGIDQTPYFIENATLSALPPDSIRRLLLKPYLLHQNRQVQAVLSSGISAVNKQLIISEFISCHLNHFNDFLRTGVKDRNTVNELLVEVFDATSITPASTTPGPQYFTFADNYLRYLETKAFMRIKSENIPPSAPIPYYNISLDSANVIVAKHGKPYWRWIGSLQNFPPEIAEPYNYQQIQNQYFDRDLGQTESLAGVFKQQFPNSPYNADIEKMITQLRTMRMANTNNDKIAILNDDGNLASVYSAVKQLKGKVVYLDIWGTWCGPCKEEIKFLPELRAAFTGKDVAFLFLAMDDDSRDAIWREFIRVNGMEGFHFRKTRKTIDPIWKELLANHPDKSEYYPQYFLFDKSGRLAIAKAKHPSDGAALYEQINGLLGKQ